MFRDYQLWGLEQAGSEEASEMLGRSTFVDIVTTLNRGQQKRKAAVDYVLGTLIYDSIKTATEIISNVVSSIDVQ